MLGHYVSTSTSRWMLLRAARAMLSSLKEHSLDFWDRSCKFFAASPTGSTSISEFASKELASPCTPVASTYLSRPSLTDIPALSTMLTLAVCAGTCVFAEATGPWRRGSGGRARSMDAQWTLLRTHGGFRQSHTRMSIYTCARMLRNSYTLLLTGQVQVQVQIRKATRGGRRMQGRRKRGPVGQGQPDEQPPPTSALHL